jgi:hypothetical protein
MYIRFHFRFFAFSSFASVCRGWDRALGRGIAYLFMRRRALVYFPHSLFLDKQSVTLFIFRSRSSLRPSKQHPTH